MRAHALLFAVLACAHVACAASTVRADEGRAQDYAPGARAASLGGAYGALSDDATGVFYNPAGLVDVRTPRVNVATHLLGIELVGASPIQSDLLRRGVTATDLIFVPGSTGYVQGVGEPLPSGAFENAFAFGTLVPQYTSRFTEEVPRDPLGTRFRSALTDRRLNAGAAWAHRFGPWLRVGAAGHYLLRTLDAEESLVSGDLNVPGAFIDATTRLRASNHAVRAIVGAKGWFGPRLTVGLAFTTPSMSVWRDVSFERTVSSFDGTLGNAPDLDVDRVRASGVELQSDLPGSMRLGVAFSEPASYTVSVDVTGHLPASYDVVSQDLLGEVAVARVPVPLRVETGYLANIAIGVDTLLSDDVSFGAGIFTNFTSAPALIVNDDGALSAASSRLSRVHMLGGSLSLGFHGRFSVTRVGITGSSGFGEIVQPTPPDARFLDGGPPLVAREANQTLLYLFWSSTFRLGEESSERDYAL
jgi:hypothetical protein